MSKLPSRAVFHRRGTPYGRIPHGQVAGFKIWPESRRGLYYYVRAFAKKSDLYGYIRICGRTPGRSTIGISMPWMIQRHENGRWCTTKFAGEICLHAGFDGRPSEVIAHEATHVALAWARRLGFAADIPIEQPRRAHAQLMVTIDSPEERFAYAVGELSRQMVKGFWDAGLFDERGTCIHRP